MAISANKFDLAYLQTMQEIKDGNYKTQSAKEHIAELMIDFIIQDDVKEISMTDLQKIVKQGKK